jgi:serine/threonine-protein kinase
MVVGQPASLAGRYRLSDALGVGGMGTVYRAHDEVLQRDVAVKILKEEYAADADSVERFRREALIAASLAHRGIAHVYDFGEDEGRCFTVMELLDGSDLHALVTNNGPVEPAAAAGIVARAADALEYAHRAGAVHRDVKPANIFLTSGGEVKVTDFGIAYAANHVAVTAVGAVVGTAGYISPEQAEGRRAIPASDVYALGCVLFHLLTGRPPYEAENQIAVAMAHSQGPVPSAKELNPVVSSEIDAIVQKALAKKPRDRFGSAGEMAKALRAGGPPAAGPPTQALSFGPPTQIATPTPPQPVVLDESRHRVRRRRARQKVLGLVTVAGLVLTALLLLSRGPAKPVAVKAPDFVGLSQLEAGARAGRSGLKIQARSVLSAAPAGMVVDQSPKAGVEVKPGNTIVVSVSDGNGVAVPDVKGMDMGEAYDRLSQAGLQGAVATKVAGSPAGVVVDQTPPGGVLVAKGTVVELTISETGKRGKGKGSD